MKSKNLFCLVMGILGAGAIIGYALYSNSYSDGGGAESDINSRDVVTTVSVSIMPSSIEEKAIKADAVVIGTVKEVSGTFTRPDPNEPERISVPFQDAVVDIDRIVVGNDEISEHSKSANEVRIRTLALSADSSTFIEGKSYLFILGSPCTDCIYGPDAFTVIGEDHGKFLLEDGKASNMKEGEMSQSELIDRIVLARQ